MLKSSTPITRNTRDFKRTSIRIQVNRKTSPFPVAVPPSNKRAKTASRARRTQPRSASAATTANKRQTPRSSDERGNACAPEGISSLGARRLRGRGVQIAANRTGRPTIRVALVLSPRPIPTGGSRARLRTCQRAPDEPQTASKPVAGTSFGARRLSKTLAQIWKRAREGANKYDADVVVA